MADEVTYDAIVLELNGKVIHPEDGDIILIYHDNPQEIQEGLMAWASAIAFTQASLVVVQPGQDIRLLPEKEMRKLGWRKIKPRKKKE